MKGVTPFLWFDHQAEEAAKYYCSIFPNSKIVQTSRYRDTGPGPKGSVMVVRFELKGQPFMSLNGGPHFKFSEAISFMVDCENQKEVDQYWEKLSQGGEKGQCGWLKDKFGPSWQVVPTALGDLVSDPDKEKANRVMSAMMKMNKIELRELEEAAAGK